MPSPQIGTQTLGESEQIQPLSFTHEELQPSPLLRLPSSHPSERLTTPSPQKGAALLLLPEVTLEELLLGQIF